MNHYLCQRLAAAGIIILCACHPVERLVRDTVLPKQEAQLGDMFLDMAHAIHLQLGVADDLSLPGYATKGP